MQMEPKRLLLMLVFAFSVIMLWENWTRYNAPKNVAPVAAQSGSAGQNASVPGPMAQSAPAGTAPVTVKEAGVPDYAAAAKTVVTTDTMKVEISARGGDITRVELLKHKDSDDSSKNLVMLEVGGKHTYVANPA